MMRALITGISGFVGPYLKKQLASNGVEVFGISRSDESERVFRGNITDKAFIDRVVATVKPDFIYHLAGFSSVRDSFNNPNLVFQVNVEGTRNILKAMRKFTPDARILIVSSAIVYGVPLNVPIVENEPTKKASPYANSRIETEKMLKENFGDLNWVVARSFNHTGPGQSTEFVVADFCEQAVRIERGEMKPVMLTGNLEVVRDFSDVRDIVNAYQMLIENGNLRETYNVGSGKGYRILDLLKEIISCIKVPIKIEEDQTKMRKIDNPLLIADIRKLVAATGWSANYDIHETIRCMVEHFRDTLN